MGMGAKNTYSSRRFSTLNAMLGNSDSKLSVRFLSLNGEHKTPDV